MARIIEVEQLKQVWSGLLTNIQLAMELYRRVQDDPEAKAALEKEFDQETRNALASLCAAGGFLQATKAVLESQLAELAHYQPPEEVKMP